MATKVAAEGPDDAERRLRMVNGQLRTSDVHDTTLLAAFLAVPRDAFVAPAFQKLAYLDQSLPAAGAERRKLLAPRILGRLLQAAEVTPGERALEVGGGSGYGTALLAELGAKAALLEADKGAASAARDLLAGKAEVVEGELASGIADYGPFDVILINGAFAVFPEALVAQLSDRGRIVALDAREGTTQGVLIRRSGRGVSERALFDAAADILPGFAKAPAFAF